MLFTHGAGVSHSLLSRGEQAGSMAVGTAEVATAGDQGGLR